MKGDGVEDKAMLRLDRLAGLGSSEPTINGIKTKAHKLVAGGLVTRAFSGDESRLVKSFSSSKPHLVQPHIHLGYQCDDSCLQYKANKVCAHTVAAAHDNNKLEEHINSFLKASPKGRLDVLCTGKPEAGRKKSQKQKRKRRRLPAQCSEEPTRASVYPWRESLAGAAGPWAAVLLLPKPIKSGFPQIWTKLWHKSKNRFCLYFDHR